MALGVNGEQDLPFFVTHDDDEDNDDDDDDDDEDRYCTTRGGPMPTMLGPLSIPPSPFGHDPVVPGPDPAVLISKCCCGGIIWDRG
jgi:hypothetical protein